jgi:predicted CoA-binding protein
MKNLIQKYFEGSSFAVVGASRYKNKYGHQVFQKLLEKGKAVYPVNPNAENIDGQKAYSTISSIPEVPARVHFIVPPDITEKVLEEVRNLRIRYVWMQPGSESDQAIEFCKKHGIHAIYNTCILTIP